MNSPKSSLFPVPHIGGTGTEEQAFEEQQDSSQDRLYQSSGNVPGTSRNALFPVPRPPIPGTEEQEHQKNTQPRFKVDARASSWKHPDETETPVIRLYGGKKGSIALDYSQLPRLIAQLAQLQLEHHQAQQDNE